MKIADMTLPCEFDHMYTSFTGPKDPNKSVSDKECSDYGDDIDQKLYSHDKNGKKPISQGYDKYYCEKQVTELEQLLLFHLEVVKNQALQLDEATQQIAELKYENALLKKKVNFLQEMQDSFQKTLAQESEKATVNCFQRDSLPINRVSENKCVSIQEVSPVEKVCEINVANSNISHQLENYDDTSLEPSSKSPLIENLELDISQTPNITRKRRDKEDKLDPPIPSKTRAVLTKQTIDSISIDSSCDVIECASVQSDNEIETFNSSDLIQFSNDQEAPVKDSSDIGPKKINHLTTKLPYRILISEIIKPQETEKPKAEEGIEIPSWRIIHCGNLYSKEGTENLDDSTFLKRHLKNETDEKRRKRWDIQRIREEKRNERLRQRYYKTEEKSPPKEDVPSSFFPDPFKIKYLYLSDELPVTAFGSLVPLLPKSEFTLPWKTALNSIDPVAASKTSKSRKSRQDIKKNSR